MTLNSRPKLNCGRRRCFRAFVPVCESAVTRIGIAIVGSIVSAVYRSDVRPSLSALPADAAGRVLKSVGQANGVVQQVAQASGTEAANGLTDAVRSAFVNGAHAGLRSVAVLAAVTALVVAWKHPPSVETPAEAGH